MTRTELYNLLNDWADGVSSKNKTLSLIWGQPFDGETEKINTTKSVSPTSPAAEDSSVAGFGNETDFATKSMTANEIMAGKMAEDLRQIRKQILAVGKYPTNLLGGSGWDTLVRMYADAERLDSHLRRRWNTFTPNPHNQ